MICKRAGSTNITETADITTDFARDTAILAPREVEKTNNANMHNPEDRDVFNIVGVAFARVFGISLLLEYICEKCTKKLVVKNIANNIESANEMRDISSTNMQVPTFKTMATNKFSEKTTHDIFDLYVIIIELMKSKTAHSKINQMLFVNIVAKGTVSKALPESEKVKKHFLA